MKRNTAVVYDACVLFPASLRDLLVELARRAFHKQYFRVKLTEKIHEEWIKSLLQARPDLSRNALERTRNLINANVPGCLIFDYEHLIPSLTLKDKDDRHVLAAAIKSAASIIVTFNLNDFPHKDLKSFSIVAKHPDEFICEFLNDYGLAGEDMLIAAVRAIKERLQNPRVSWKQYFTKLEIIGLQQTVKKLKQLISI